MAALYARPAWRRGAGGRPGTGELGEAGDEESLGESGQEQCGGQAAGGDLVRALWGMRWIMWWARSLRRS
jgi:hypothetical protein